MLAPTTKHEAKVPIGIQGCRVNALDSITLGCLYLSLTLLLTLPLDLGLAPAPAPDAAVTVVSVAAAAVATAAVAAAAVQPAHSAKTFSFSCCS